MSVWSCGGVASTPQTARGDKDVQNDVNRLQSDKAHGGGVDERAQTTAHRVDALPAGKEGMEKGTAGDGGEGWAQKQEDNAEKLPCPSDMVHVQHDFCPEVERVCIHEEYSKANRISLCHEFKEGVTTCKKPRQRLNFCIDKYEYPNKKGAHPVWMVSWHDAQATCRHLGKRTCWDWEWEAACEGPLETPFPYGWKRDNSKCNIDNVWIEPRIQAMYSSNPQVANRELSRLDQSVPSGSMPECVSGYGVYDLTGNLDEWVTRTGRDKRVSLWAGLKGGAWGHVRNACRPMTTSHAPEFTYYFISFRCCKDTEGSTEEFVPSGSTAPPVTEPKDKAPVPEPINPPGPSKQKVAPARR